jgi:hypothetical protein
MQPQPWPLPPPRVASQERDAALTPRIPEPKDSNATETDVSSSQEDIKEVEPSEAHSAPVEADHEAGMKISLQPIEHKLDAAESGSNVSLSPWLYTNPFQVLEIRKYFENLFLTLRRFIPLS